MNVQEALEAAGVRPDTLSPEEKAFLDSEGYLPLRGVLSMEEVETIRAELARMMEEEGENAGKEVHQEAGTERLSDLVNKAPVFSVALNRPRVLAGIAHVLQYDLKLSSLNARAALPGQGLQALHADWGRLETPGEYQVCNSIWLLDDFTLQNGATRVVPGTHLQQAMPKDVLSDPRESCPQEIILTGSAGDVVIFNAHVWHGGTLNRTEHPRRAMHGYFTRRSRPQQLDQVRYLRPETAQRLSQAERVILGVEGG